MRFLNAYFFASWCSLFSLVDFCQYASSLFLVQCLSAEWLPQCLRTSACFWMQHPKQRRALLRNCLRILFSLCMPPPPQCMPAVWLHTVRTTLISELRDISVSYQLSKWCLWFFAGLYMNQMGYPTHPYGSYHSLAHASGTGGTMMASQMAMMGQQQSGMMGVQQSSMIGVQQNGMMGQQTSLMGAQGVMTQPGGVMPSPYMTGMPQGMMGQQQSGMIVQQQNGIMGQQQTGMMGQQQVGGLATLPHQQAYGVQQAQQLQWNIAQVCVCLCFGLWVLKAAKLLLMTSQFFLSFRWLSTWPAWISTTPMAWWDTVVNTWEARQLQVRHIWPHMSGNDHMSKKWWRKKKTLLGICGSEFP